MRKSLLNQYIQEILTFADDEEDVVIESNKVTFERLNQIISVQIESIDDVVYIIYNNSRYPYKTFLAKELAHLDIMASKIMQKYASEDERIYGDAQATVFHNAKRYDGGAEKLLSDECVNNDNFDTRICFVTADAGHGKTVLLRHMQYVNALLYQKSQSNHILWHIDLHGRDLLRLNEAMMYEIGVLRLSGLYYNSIITLIRNGLIVLAIDGFDELAAEIGGEKVLGSLTNLVAELDGQGTIIAASRRTFFNTQDYLKRSKLLQGNIGQACEFNEIKLHNWKKEQCVQYLTYFYDKDVANNEFDKMASMLRDTESHPVIERPFLFTKLVNYAAKSEPITTPSEFLISGGSQFDSINRIIEAFIRREVQKWTYFDKHTGKPYLTFEQHVELLTEIAQEMWHSQKDYISVDTIQYIVTILMETWNVETELRPQIIRIVESHAFLVISENGDNFRRFDHEEFKDYFIACYLSHILKESCITQKFDRLKSFLYLSQMQESVARYLTKMVDDVDKSNMVSSLLQMKSTEWRPSYLQSNLGILLPYLLDNCTNKGNVILVDNITFSSIIFENRILSCIVFRDCNFINISFSNTKLVDISFEKCTFSDIRINTKKTNSFSNVCVDENSIINKVTKVDDDNDDGYSEYSPANIDAFLLKYGILHTQKNKETTSITINKHSEFRKLVRRFLNKFIKSSHQYEENFRDDQEYYSMPYKTLVEEIIPLMTEYGIITEVHNKNTQQRSSRAWALNHYDISEIFKAEENKSSPLFKFWETVNNHL